MHSRSRQILSPACWPYVLLAVFLVPSLHWIWRDFSVWPWDPAWYGEVSVRLWNTLATHPAEWPHAMLGAFGAKAPGIAWLGQFFVPIGQALGSIECGMLLSVLITQIGTLSLTYNLGKTATGRIAVGFAGVSFIAAAPLFIAMSHQYFVESLQLFAVTYFFWLAARSASMSKMKILNHFLTAMALGLLAKITSPAYCGFAGLIIVYDLCRKHAPNMSWIQEWKSGLTRRSISTFIPVTILLAMTLGWYANNFVAIHNFAVQASSGDDSLHYGKRDAFIHKLGYWLDCLQQNMGQRLVLTLLGLGMLTGLLIAIKTWRQKNRPGFTRFDIVAAAALLHVLMILTLFSLNVNQENRYLLPLAASLAVLVMWCLAQIRLYHDAPVWAACAMLSVQWLMLHMQVHGYIEPLPHVAYWLQVVHRDDGQMREIEKIARLTCTLPIHERYNVVGVEEPWLNANTMSLYNAKAMLTGTPMCYYTSLGYAETDINKAWQRVTDMKAPYYITLKAGAQKPPDFINMVSLPILQKVQRGKAFTSVPFDSKFNVLIFRNAVFP